MNKPVFLTIAGSDPCGGAGIQTDLKTADRLGCYGCSVVTAVTAQNSCGVSAIWPLKADLVEHQLLAILEDISPDAVKIGMMPDISIVKAVGRILRSFSVRNIVVDPLLAPSVGKSFSDDCLIAEMAESIFPIASLITPNLPELKTICGALKKTESELGKAVLIKGGHSSDSLLSDRLIVNEEDGVKNIIFNHPKIDTPNSHGSGCVLSSAIACGLAHGLTLKEAVGRGVDFVSDSLTAGKSRSFGKCGYGPTLF